MRGAGLRYGSALPEGLEFRRVPSAPGYFAGADGSIFSTLPCPGRPPVRELKQDIDHDKYPTVRISIARGRKVSRRKVPRLVAEAFHGPRPEGLQIRHLDGNPHNNTPSNLKYGTARENADDRIRHGTQVRGENAPGAVFTDAEVRAAVQRVIDGELPCDVADSIGARRSSVQKWYSGESRKGALVGLDLSLIEPNRRARGDRSPIAVVTDAQIREMKQLVAGGMKQVAVASIYGVHPATVSRMVRGVWRDVA